MKTLLPLFLMAASFAGGVRYQQIQIDKLQDQSFHTTRALQGCELIASQTLHQVMQAEYQAEQCKAEQVAFIEALNNLGEISETPE